MRPEYLCKVCNFHFRQSGTLPEAVIFARSGEVVWRHYSRYIDLRIDLTLVSRTLLSLTATAFQAVLH
jgi:hypothetical protein